MILDKKPYLTYETKTLFSGTNAHVYAQRYGNVVTIQIFNMSPSVLQSTSVSIPTSMRPKSRVDVPLGWVYKSATNTSIPITTLLTDSGYFTGMAYYSNSTGKLETLTDSDGNCFGTVTYVI